MDNVPTCYYPSGTSSSPDTPCHSDDRASACCAQTDTCLSNGLCLAQGGPELITRGSCTDESWQSPECPQYCSDGKKLFEPTVKIDLSQPWLWLSLSLNLNADIGFAVHTVGGALIFPAGNIRDQFLFCCSPFNPSNNTCAVATKGSYAPFSLEAGQVIFNRTSGSTSTNIANPATVTKTVRFTVHATATNSVTAAALTSLSKSPSFSTTPLACSSREAAVGAGLGVALGLAVLVTLGLLWLLWRQRKHKQSLRTDVQTWEWRYHELTTKVVSLSGDEHQLTHHLPAWTPRELDGRSTSFPSEMADTPRSAR